MSNIGKLNLDHLVGMEVGTAVLLEKLGHGAMSAVFVAFQKTLKRRIAVKILPKSVLTKKTAAFFQQEAESTAILSHPNIIPIYEVGETDEFLFFTMQLVKGYELTHAIRQARKNIVPSKRWMPLQTVINLVEKVLHALAYAHENDIVHRDIKPGNIMIEKHTNRPLITDFGVAKATRTKGKNNRMLLGTPKYMAPEQILSGNVDGRADQYSAATMMLEMLLGELPYPSYKSVMDLLKMKLSMKEKIFQQWPSRAHPTADRALDKILFKALAFDKNHRFATCSEFAEELDRYLKKRRLFTING